MSTARRVACLQAAYYATTGAWAVVHRRSFEAVTGQKREYWLVRTVGALALANGAALAAAAGSGRRREGAVLALGTGLAFVASDLQAARVASRVYLADALLHLALLPAWFLPWEDEGGPRTVGARGGEGSGGREAAGSAGE